MKPRFPLYAKILGWFFLNLLVLCVIAILLVRGQFRFGLDMLIAGRGGERIQGLANGLASELAAQPREEWDQILSRFGSGYGVQLGLYRPDGGHVAGEKLELPRQVAERLRERMSPMQRPNNPGFRPGGGPGDDFPRPLNDRRRGPQPDEPETPPAQPPAVAPEASVDSPPPQPRPPGNMGGRPVDGLRPPTDAFNPMTARPRFMVSSSDPTRYWVGVPLPPVDAQRPQARLALLAVSNSLRGGGLFFDYTPWLIVGGAVVLLSVLFWLPLVRSITRTISGMTRATGEIAEGRFDARVPETRNDELGELAAAVNQMAARLAGFVTGQKRFLGDTAHELCAPIARMQLALGVLEQRADEKQKPYVNDVREELQHISSLVNELLSFSKAGLRPKAAALQLVNLAEIGRRVAEREGRGGGTITVNIPSELQALAEPELLSRALANLVRNALRYAGTAGPVSIAARTENDRVVLSVTDEGPGVPPDALQKIFDPFYRVEESRSRETGGVGLGLAIVKTCVEACDGTVTAQNRSPHGLEVRISLRAN